MAYAIFANTNTGWNMAYPARTEEDALRALLGIVNQFSTAIAHLGLDGLRTLSLDLHMPGEAPVQYVARLCPHTGNDWKVFVAGGMLADGSDAQRYPNPVAAVLALGAQAASLLLNP